MGKSFVIYLVGYATAHLYLYIKGPLFIKYQRDFLPTPSLLKSIVKIYLDWEARQLPLSEEGEGEDDQ